MTNFEKYQVKIREGIDFSNDFCVSFIIPKVLEPIGKKCSGLACSQCHKSMLEWLMDEYKEPKVDWSKVPVDTKIYVRSYEDDDWRPRYFAKYGDGVVWCWGDGKTSWSSKPGDSLTCWAYAKLAEETDEDISG